MFFDVQDFFINREKDTETHELVYQIYSTDKSKTYTIGRHKILRRWDCSCPDYVYRKLKYGRICKHGSILKNFLGV